VPVSSVDAVSGDNALNRSSPMKGHDRVDLVVDALEVEASKHLRT